MSLIPVGVTRNVFRAGLQLKKHAPSLMFAGGIVGAIGSTVMACKATLDLSEELPDMKAELNDVKAHPFEDEEAKRKTLAYVYGKNTVRVVQLYAPAAIVGAASIGLLTGSHVTLNRRNAGLTAAYAAMSRAYDEYRERVQDELGKDREEAIYHSADLKKIENESGKTEATLVADPNRWSPYARFFDEENENWVKNPELNRLFVQCQQNYLNHLLHARGHVFLNEAYDQLGLERSQAGQVVGWILHDGPDGGDNYIDFGIFEATSSRFVNGWERNIILDFNVDGVIYDKI